jgi:hypothetical protein
MQRAKLCGIYGNKPSLERVVGLTGNRGTQKAA